MSAIFELELRHRATPDESITARHERFMRAMARYAAPWGLKGLELPPARDVAPGALSSVVKLRALSPKREMSYIKYVFRGEHYLKDNAQFDDHAILLFEAPALAHRMGELFDEVLPAYVEAFECYKATVCDPEVRLADWQRVVELSRTTGKDPDGRDGVYRIHPANFFDGELCRRAFGLAAEAMVKRLHDKVEKATLLAGGLLLVCSSKLELARAEYEAIDGRVRAGLR
jgi:hypothetical protein